VPQGRDKPERVLCLGERLYVSREVSFMRVDWLNNRYKKYLTYRTLADIFNVYVAGQCEIVQLF